MNQKNLDRYYEAKIASKKADMIVDLEKLIAKAEAAGIQREIIMSTFSQLMLSMRPPSW